MAAQEFRAWLIEERVINRETLSKEQEKKLFAVFVEDFNTGLPFPLSSLCGLSMSHFSSYTTTREILCE